MVHTRNSFDDLVKLRAEDGASKGPAAPVIAAAHGMEKLAHSLYNCALDRIPIQPAQHAADNGSLNLNLAIIWRKHSQPRGNQSPVAEEFKDGLAQIRAWRRCRIVRTAR